MLRASVTLQSFHPRVDSARFHPRVVPLRGRDPQARAMTYQNLAELSLGILLVAFIGIRQLRWRPFDPARVWTMPVVFAAIGIVLILQSRPANIHPIDFLLLGIEAALAIAVGALMGAISAFRTAPATPDSAVPVFETRSGWLGFALWTVLIGVRVGLAIWGSSLGAELVESAGVILLVLSLNRTARGAVIALRHRKRSAPGVPSTSTAPTPTSAA